MRNLRLSCWSFSACSCLFRLLLNIINSPLHIFKPRRNRHRWKRQRNWNRFLICSAFIAWKRGRWLWRQHNGRNSAGRLHSMEETHCLIPVLLLLQLQLDDSDLLIAVVLQLQRPVSVWLLLMQHQQHSLLSWFPAWTNQVKMHLLLASEYFERLQTLRYGCDCGLNKWFRISTCSNSKQPLVQKTLKHLLL